MIRKHYKITIKEIGVDKPVETEYSGFIDRKRLITFYGLNNPDVEWFDIDRSNPIFDC